MCFTAAELIGALARRFSEFTDRDPHRANVDPRSVHEVPVGPLGSAFARELDRRRVLAPAGNYRARPVLASAREKAAQAVA
jgi:hypothetical protein